MKARDKRKSGKRVIPLGNAPKHRLLLQKLESLRKKPQTDQDEPEGSMGWEDLSDSIKLMPAYTKHFKHPNSEQRNQSVNAPNCRLAHRFGSMQVGLRFCLVFSPPYSSTFPLQLA